ncbi:hypothetical protein ACQ4M4_09840 [Leptolyngbya sp. AN02str]|uniref:hypothetical protein n=1 Tax=Leptolyngbya sp. AN02str TaxID=3423363 RepID=UPI003D3201D9
MQQAIPLAIITASSNVAFRQKHDFVPVYSIDGSNFDTKLLSINRSQSLRGDQLCMQSYTHASMDQLNLYQSVVEP